MKEVVDKINEIASPQEVQDVMGWSQPYTSMVLSGKKGISRKQSEKLLSLFGLEMKISIVPKKNNQKSYKNT